MATSCRKFDLSDMKMLHSATVFPNVDLLVEYWRQLGLIMIKQSYSINEMAIIEQFGGVEIRHFNVQLKVLSWISIQ